MFATVMYGPGDVRFEQVDDPKIIKPTDAIIQLSATCVCGSDLWPYRGLQPTDAPAHMGHEYCGTVLEVGGAVKTVRPGQFVVGSFCLSDNTCPTANSAFSPLAYSANSWPERRRRTRACRWQMERSLLPPRCPATISFRIS